VVAGASTAPAPPAPLRMSERGDGNCLFHGLARQCLNNSDFAMQARQDVVDWMEQNLRPSVVSAGCSQLSASHGDHISRQLSDVVNINGDDADFLEYIQKMRKPGEWGSGLEALCAAYRYSCSVCIWADFSGEDQPMDIIEPPNCLNHPVGLLHVGGNHWDSMLIPTDWGKDGRPPARLLRRPATDAEDRAFLEEDVPKPVIDASRTDDQRHEQRERTLARYASASKPSSKGSSSSCNRSGQLALAMQVKANSGTSAITDAKLDRCMQVLLCNGVTEREALEALTASGADAQKVLKLYGLEHFEETC